MNEADFYECLMELADKLTQASSQFTPVIDGSIEAHGYICGFIRGMREVGSQGIDDDFSRLQRSFGPPYRDRNDEAFHEGVTRAIANSVRWYNEVVDDGV